MAEKTTQRPDHWKQAICRELRPLLEQRHGIRFAPLELAQRFAFEHQPPEHPTFGFHGALSLPLAMPEQDLVWALERLPERMWTQGKVRRWIARLHKLGRSGQALRLHRHCLQAFPEQTAGWPAPSA